MRPFIRLLVVVLGVAATACADAANPTAPPLRPTTPRFDIDSSMCRSGYNMAQGRCNDPQ